MHIAEIIYSIGVSAPITPAEPLHPLPEIPRGSLVVVEGSAPVWRYSMALHLLHGSPAAAIAFFDPFLGDGGGHPQPRVSVRRCDRCGFTSG